MSLKIPPSASRLRPVARLVSVVTVIALALTTPLAHATPRGQGPIEEAKKFADPFLAGANDWDCEPSAERRKPVVLVHGIFGTATMNWPFVSPRLADAGFCVFAPIYGMNGGLLPLPAAGALEDSAKELATFVDGVLAATGADQVDIVGLSAGGLMPRQYLRFEDGAEHVDNFVALGPPNHGTDFNLFEGLPPNVADALCPSCRQFSTGSEFLGQLNDGREVEAGVSYTTISTVHDAYIVPYTSAVLNGSAEQITNVTLQDACPDDASDHLALAFSELTLQWVLNALETPGPADPDFAPEC